MKLLRTSPKTALTNRAFFDLRSLINQAIAKDIYPKLQQIVALLIFEVLYKKLLWALPQTKLTSHGSFDLGSLMDQAIAKGIPQKTH